MFFLLGRHGVEMGTSPLLMVGTWACKLSRRSKLSKRMIAMTRMRRAEICNLRRIFKDAIESSITQPAIRLILVQFRAVQPDYRTSAVARDPGGTLAAVLQLLLTTQLPAGSRATRWVPYLWLRRLIVCRIVIGQSACLRVFRLA